MSKILHMKVVDRFPLFLAATARVHVLPIHVPPVPTHPRRHCLRSIKDPQPELGISEPLRRLIVPQRLNGRLKLSLGNLVRDPGHQLGRFLFREAVQPLPRAGSRPQAVSITTPKQVGTQRILDTPLRSF